MNMKNDGEMHVLKRNGQYEIVSFDKILRRVRKLGVESNMSINYTSLTMKVIDQLFDKIPTIKIDELTAEICASMSSLHPDYNILAGKIMISNYHKATSSSFSKVMSKLYNFKDKNDKNSPLVSRTLIDVVKKNAETLDKMCDYQRDYLIDYFGFKTLERSYLMRINRVPVERPQHLWLRVSIGIHGDNLEKVRETYEYMSQKYFTHATPTLFNAGTPRPQLSSCFLIAMQEDSIDGIFSTLADCAKISKHAGGIGMHIHNIRALGSHIRGTNGTSNGIVPMLRVFNNTAKYVDQCLDPETIVYTKRGAITIKEIIVGDKVIADDGNMYKIGKVLDSCYTGNYYSVDIEHSMQIMKLTDMHPLWAFHVDGDMPNTDANKTEILRNLLEKGLIKPDFIEVKNLHEGDYVGFPIPKYVKDVAQFSEYDCQFYGILFAIGEFDSETYITYITLSKISQASMVEFIQGYLHDNMIPFLVTNENDIYITFSWEINNRMKFTYNMYHNEYGNKRLLPSLLHLPLNKVKSFTKGFLLAKAYFRDYSIIIKEMEYSVLENLRYLFLRMGILTVGNTENTLYIPCTRELHELFDNPMIQITDEINYIEHGGMLFSRVTSNKFQRNYDGRVIDIEVDNEEHHNFLTHSGLVKNGGGKRNGSFAIYLETWHLDIEMFLQMRKNQGDDELKARDLFYAVWVSDLFMERVKNNEKWTLMCPDECPGLADVYGDEFRELYTSYEAKERGRKTINARDLWFQILDAQMETGTPYLLFKDSVNRKSNQKNIGTIKSSNLCCEIMEVSTPDETAVCNLASIGLPTFVDTTQSPPVFDFEKLHKIARVITYNLNRVIDINYYPTEKTRKSNLRHRPIGIGVQGLADVFMMMNYSFTSDEAKQLNKDIFETIYHGALEESLELAKTEGAYETFAGSPASQGKLQFDLWDYDPTNKRYDWDALKQDIMKFGIRNSLLLAPMPTASTSQILGFNECFEPITSNIYSRRTIAGDFIMVNKYLMRDLIAIDKWNDEIKQNIIANNGSVQQLEDIIPRHQCEKYRTVWEYPMKQIIEMSSERGVFICQSQSLNLWVQEPNYQNLTAMHFYSWSKGLKTGVYYLRRRAVHSVQKFTVEPEKKENGVMDEESEYGCLNCSA